MEIVQMFSSVKTTC